MWLELQIFGFRAMWSPFFFVFLLGIGIAYHLITGPYRKRFGGQEKPNRNQKVSFYLGLLLIYIAKGSPVDLLSHIMLTAHMTQMALYLIITPILIIKGLPVWIWRNIIEAPFVGSFLRFATKPIISLLLFNGLFSIYHIPVIFNFSKSAPVAHTTIHVILLIAAFVMWLPLLAPIKEFDHLKPILKVGYIFVNSVLITPACVLIIFSSVPLYAAYTQDGAWLTALSLCVPGDVLNSISTQLNGPETFSPLSVMIDQQLGGIIMKVIQEIAYGSILASILFNWFKEDGNKIDPLPANSVKSR
ncbi:cytochrome c oxidase assembly factor CtaG [Oceanobacillus piezotolerans]|uniref:Cytochrome c oxidase assembly factor CtaG n=1 Tax=Oceanobacillus piezotolerans TaxID=2448030 RepID=A0A498DNA3_9BACI|nr:cytochrome c oxidase assembly factor CtaG [Oceanobacillus piezotolerans]RLL45212.1 cytochrome c oxidase assembly factor CtaG [Oceanobacillus piezotolerans]